MTVEWFDSLHEEKIDCRQDNVKAKTEPSVNG